MSNVCSCHAYKFPHRSGGGKCHGVGMYCTSCGKSCEGSIVDNGIGGYEYAGSRGVDVQLDVESECCGDIMKWFATSKNVTVRDLERRMEDDRM